MEHRSTLFALWGAKLSLQWIWFSAGMCTGISVWEQRPLPCLHSCFIRREKKINPSSTLIPFLKLLSPSTKHVLASLTVGESHSPSTSGEGKLFTSTSFYAQKILSTPTFSVFTGKIINSNLKKKIDRNRETNRERIKRKKWKEGRKGGKKKLCQDSDNESFGRKTWKSWFKYWYNISWHDHIACEMLEVKNRWERF